MASICLGLNVLRDDSKYKYMYVLVSQNKLSTRQGLGLDERLYIFYCQWEGR